MKLPSMTTCTHCHLPYYQTSAPHVCAGGVRAKENRTMNTTTITMTEDHVCDRWQTPHRKNMYCINPRPVPATEHEPVARGGEGELWNVEGGSLVGRRRIRDAMNYWVADAATDDRAEQIVTEHNSYHSLLAEQDSLREALKGVAIMLNTELEKYDNEPWAQRVRAALNDQKGVASADQKGGEG